MTLASTKFHQNGRTAAISLDRVQGHNALSGDLCDAVAHELEEAVAQGSRAVVLHSTAVHFSVGADLRERQGLDKAGLLRARERSAALTHALVTCPVPVIAAVHGFTIGGGLELALAADIIIAEESAILSLPEAGIGIVPGGGGTQLLARRVGWGAANLMVYTGRRIEADIAERMHLVDEVVAVGEGLRAALELANEIASKNPQSVRLIKEVTLLGAGHSVDEALRIEDRAWRVAAMSEDYQQGLASFAGKTTPPWA
ncbi:enoyl-CoA hydratase/isomerase family protein [Leucobacter sp. Z1108]|uniref:enoyl-CoA hydratase/isomerase family protein n=1 Tax=Leucobacter sp. Z1108 TaxID=3439066 RepID=UPI003F376B0D